MVDTNTYRVQGDDWNWSNQPIRGLYCNPIDQSESVTLIWPDIRDIVTRSQTSSTSGHTGEAELIIEEKLISTHQSLLISSEQDIGERAFLY